MNLNPFNWFKKEDPDPFLLEAQDIFKKKGNPVSQKDLEKIKGEGFEELGGFGVTGLHSYSTFYNRYINQQFESENEKIREYRKMADMPEIADVIEDAVNESTQVDDNGKVLHLEFLNKELANNTNVVDNITKEFNDFFYSKLRIQDLLDDLFYSYYTDGRLYCECIINPNNSKEGIQKLKKLPAESMDFEYDRTTGQILHFYQYLKPGCKRPDNRAEAEKDPHIIVFEPKQILHLTFGKFGKSKKEVFGFLEKAKQPFNQLKLLETSVIIYRIVRAPERFVFKIDVGNMPRDKALKYVEKIKQKFNKKMVYDPQTGQMAYDTNVMSMLENFFVPQCLSLNTRIPLLTGEIKTLADLIEDHKNGIINEVYSIDQNTLKPIRGFVQWAGITRKDAELIRVHLDNGEFIDCTPDHRFVLRDGSECEAQYLTEGASLMPLYNSKEIDVKKIERLSHKEDTGCLTVVDENNNHNFALAAGVFVKNSENRGSDISTIGGNPGGFAQLDDLRYFANKLYRAMKYPISRVNNAFERTDGNNLFNFGGVGEINRDEIKWAKFLQKHQSRICKALCDLFLLHLEFKGLKKQFNLDDGSLSLAMNAPNNYEEHMRQKIRETTFLNYNTLAVDTSFSKSFLMRKYLKYDDDTIKANIKGFEEDKQFRSYKDDMADPNTW